MRFLFYDEDRREFEIIRGIPDLSDYCNQRYNYFVARAPGDTSTDNEKAPFYAPIKSKEGKI